MFDHPYNPDTVRHPGGTPRAAMARAVLRDTMGVIDVEMEHSESCRPDWAGINRTERGGVPRANLRCRRQSGDRNVV
jgi:hypothetical protein